jgi:hypothetical protein
MRVSSPVKTYAADDEAVPFTQPPVESAMYPEMQEHAPRVLPVGSAAFATQVLQLASPATSQVWHLKPHALHVLLVVSR